MQKAGLRLCNNSLEAEVLPSSPDNTLPLCVSAKSVRENESSHVDASFQTDSDYVRSLELDNASLRAELLQIKNSGSGISIELFKANNDMLSYTQVCLTGPSLMQL